MPLLETCSELFGTCDLYTVLGVEKSASQGQIKKAYHKVCGFVLVLIRHTIHTATVDSLPFLNKVP